MLSPEIIKKIRLIEIHTKRLLSGILVGDHSSARRGSGFDFDQIREYQMGDDVRFIDWNSSAKMNKLLVKQYIEERNRTVIIVVDISSSHFFSSSNLSKSDVIANVAAVLSLVTDYGKDHASLILFSDEVELVIPPGTGQKHIRHIMQKLFTHKPKKRGTNISAALKCLATMKPKNAIVFLISDFIDQNFKRSLQVMSRQYDIVAIRCLDTNEITFPSVGFLTVHDIETDEQCLLDTRSDSSSLSAFLEQRLSGQVTLFKQCGIDYFQVSPDKPFIGDIIRFFRRRMMY